MENEIEIKVLQEKAYRPKLICPECKEAKRMYEDERLIGKGWTCIKCGTFVNKSLIEAIRRIA